VVLAKNASKTTMESGEVGDSSHQLRFGETHLMEGMVVRALIESRQNKLCGVTSLPYRSDP